MQKAAYQAKQAILCHPHSKLSLTADEVSFSTFDMSLLRSSIAKLRDSACLLNLHSICGPKLSFPYRVVLLRSTQGFDFDAYINPRIVQAEAQHYGMWESCISLDGISAWLTRSRSISVESCDESGNAKRVTLQGLAARLFLHEMDHLSGECIITRAKSRQFVVTSNALMQKHLWEANFPSPEAFATPMFCYYDFASRRVERTPELAMESAQMNTLFPKDPALSG
ncbi:hypothetical protein XU18_0639 [Perkinsela sp. CCAP 1560/4]|nr:hypothetical protein XU18_4910 [Perkinsela sp. CCAP 1560/4]KNH09044.1 hypothetical protein XU18_0639 [Perkinsela sp. CCAP 1560/4]|eukprot:KNH03834.1 hypothetical protein XU18_4910 [Perkinsela sp. CCAP 1560/4]